MFDRLDDTIVAISSPPGAGVRGIVRLSGPDALELADAVFTADDASRLAQTAGHRRTKGHVRLDERSRLPAEAYTFRKPASYTRQDLVELHTIGSAPVLAVLLEQLVRQGARIAEPGEFTGRAFFSGALDLTAVEGVAAAIHAQTDAQLRASTALLHGAVSRQTGRMREELADLLALIEAQIDFSEEPIEFISTAALRGTVQDILARLNHLLRHSDSVERLEALPRIVLTGLPNAGKSTLFNRLTGIDRAIQSAVAGTTRDVITAAMSLPAGEVILCDTAGTPAPDDPETSAAASPLAAEMESATRRALDTADLVLVVIDATTSPEATMSLMAGRLAGRRFEFVLNKIDAADARVDPREKPVLAAVSAVRGEGIAELRARIDEILFESAEKHGFQLVSLTQRHRGALHEACESLHRALALIDAGDACEQAQPELIALEIRHAMQALSLLLGEVTTEDLLGRIFSRFCIGK